MDQEITLYKATFTSATCLFSRRHRKPEIFTKLAVITLTAELTKQNKKKQK
jgi:hypothetical protein